MPRDPERLVDIFNRQWPRSTVAATAEHLAGSYKGRATPRSRVPPFLG
jgi:hypothetical protein